MGRPLEVVAIGPMEPAVLEGLALRLAAHGFEPRLAPAAPEVGALAGPGVARLQALSVLPLLRRGRKGSVLGLTELELTDGVRPWVYGMAEVNGWASVFSTRPFRSGALKGEVFLDRLASGVLHELAHTIGMVHCRRRGCLMHATHEPAALRQLGGAFCAPCERTWRRRIGGRPAGAPATSRAASSRGSPRTP